MKNKIFFIVLFAFLPVLTYAGIPFADQTQPSGKNVIVENKADKETKQDVKAKKIRKQNFISKALDYLKGDRTSNRATMNTLSFVGAMLALILVILGGAIIAIPVAIASFILGIIGLRRGERLQGLGIAGVALSGSLIVLFILLILLLAAFLEGL